MQERWFIIADDLTGAADSAIAFARRGVTTRVLLHETWRSDEHTVVASFDANTRRGTAAAAAARHVTALRLIAATDFAVFKKIDSTLRGHLAAEIAAMRGVLAKFQRSTFGVMAPAYPAMGRTTLEGRVFVHGKPLEESETWRREHAYASADLAEILATVGIAAIKVPLNVVRKGIVTLLEELRSVAREPGRDGLGRVAICDAETDGDLDNIATAVRASHAPGFLIGTAGLAHSLARSFPARTRTPLVVPRSNAGALIVVGSLASASRDAARAVASESRLVHARIEPRTLLDAARRDELGAARAAVVDAVRNGVDVLVEIVAEGEIDLSLGPALASALADALGPAMASASGIVVTGGETARALLSKQRVDEVELVDEIEDGLCLGLARGDSGFALITKSGAFGNAGSLVRALEKLRQIRATGILA